MFSYDLTVPGGHNFTIQPFHPLRELIFQVKFLDFIC
ncbi:MAG: hypothetical protein J6P87_01630 [Lachnospiraceae bacterium]|nr:hypothetical protein [Lachnospiraceae bacterium]